jgi:hypothetical protein
MGASPPDFGTTTWRKSSYSNGGQNNCVEVADRVPGVVPIRDSKNPGPALLVPTAAWRAFVTDLSTARWRKSSHSNADGGDCVEVADGIPGLIPVRDSKNPGPALLPTTAVWQAFVTHIKR